MITIEYLEGKRKEYEAAYLEHLALANANNGAMSAIIELIQLSKKSDSAVTPKDDGGKAGQVAAKGER